MFKIEDGRPHFYQWDLDRKIIVDREDITELHFSTATTNNALVVKVKNGVADVPNILLQDCFDINVYGYDTNYTKVNAIYEVIKRAKPDDYVYTETEVLRYEDLEERIAALEEAEVDVDLSNYYTKAETDELLADVEVDLSGLATEAYVDTAIASALGNIGVAEEGEY